MTRVCSYSWEAATYLLSVVLGWNIVPRTWLRDRLFGEGMVQLWQETDPKRRHWTWSRERTFRTTGGQRLNKGDNPAGFVLTLQHMRTRRCGRWQCSTVNTADRKGDHVLAMAGFHRYGVDHGLTFHSEHKLRTVLWGWIGDELSAEEIAGLPPAASDCIPKRVSPPQRRRACGALAAVLRKSRSAFAMAV